MKWLLLVLIVSLVAFSYKQSRDITDLTEQLDVARAKITELQSTPKSQPLTYDPFHKPSALTPNQKPPTGGTLLDVRPDSHRR